MTEAINLTTEIKPGGTAPLNRLKPGQLYSVQGLGRRQIAETSDPARDMARCLEIDWHNPDAVFSLIERDTGKTVFTGVVNMTAIGLPSKDSIDRWNGDGSAMWIR